MPDNLQPLKVGDCRKGEGRWEAERTFYASNGSGKHFLTLPTSDCSASRQPPSARLQPPASSRQPPASSRQPPAASLFFTSPASVTGEPAKWDPPALPPPPWRSPPPGPAASRPRRGGSDCARRR